METHFESMIFFLLDTLYLAYPNPYPVLNIKLPKFTVNLHIPPATRHLLHEGAQLQSLGHQGPAHCSEVCVCLGGEGKMVSEIDYIIQIVLCVVLNIKD